LRYQFPAYEEEKRSRDFYVYVRAIQMNLIYSEDKKVSQFSLENSTLLLVLEERKENKPPLIIKNTTSFPSIIKLKLIYSNF
jgi:hypothetical protein